MLNANSMELGNIIDLFLALRVRARTPIIRSIRCWVAAYGFLHQVFGWVVVLRAAAWVSRPPSIQKLGAENHMLQLNIQCSW